MSPEDQLTEDITVILLQQRGLLPQDIYDTADDQFGFIGKTIKRRLKKRFASMKRLIKNPGKEIKRESRRIVKKVKSVAPYVVAGVATYYGGPAGAALGKRLIMRDQRRLAKKSYKKQMRKNMIISRPTIPNDFQRQGGVNTQSAIDFTQNWTNNALRNQGVNVRSPMGNQVVQDYMRNIALNEKAGFDIKNLIIPAVAGAGALLLLKG